MKTYKAITVDGEMALKRLPEIIPLRKNFKHAIEFYHALQKHDIDYKEIESEPIIKVAPEYKDFWKDGDMVRDDEFEINQFAKVKEGTKWIYEGAVLRVLGIRPFGQFEKQYGNEYKLCLKGTKWENSYQNPCTYIYQKDLEIMSFAIPKPKEDKPEAYMFSDLRYMAGILPAEDFIYYAKQHYSITKKTTTL